MKNFKKVTLRSKMAGFMRSDRLKYFSRGLNPEGTLQILLISTSQSYLEKLAAGIYNSREVQRDKRNYNLKVHTCKSVLHVLESMPEEFSVDFIAFIIDSRMVNSLTEVQNNLSWLDTSFTREKICLINPDYNYSRAVISPQDIWDFVKIHQFNIINGKTKDQKDMFNLTKRILNLAEACCGILNGVPMINPV